MSKLAVDIDAVVPILEKEVRNYAVPVVDLIAVQSGDPYKVLVSAILSARTKDETTAKSAARLFKSASDLASLATLSKQQIAKLIYPVGFYNNKAAHLAELPAAIDKHFSGSIPEDVDSLVKLPGVGRKTANLVVAVAFKKPAICVDTHVHRIMNIWGYVRTKTPLETEMALRQKLPKNHWMRINSILVAFGEGTCTPVRPFCYRCVIEQYCPQIGVTPRKPPGEQKEMNMKGVKKFLSWNVNGLRAVEKKGFVETVLEMDPDIIAVQEIKAQVEQLPEKMKNLKGYKSYWYPAERKGYSGVGIYAKKEPLAVIYGMDSQQYDQEGRVLTLEYDDFYFINTYFPNSQHGLTRLDFKIAFDNDFLKFANELAAKKSVVICGDFNVAHKGIDLANPKQNEKNAGFTKEERAWMDSFVEAGYLDTFRKFNQEAGQYSWWTYRFNARAKKIGWRIDYFFVDGNSEQRVKDAAILQDVMGSDHCPVQLLFK